MENFQFRLFTYLLEAQIFLTEVAPNVLTNVPWCGSLRTCLFHTQSHITLTALHKNFFVTPLALHTRHLSFVSDQLGQCLLSQTSSIATCDSTLGGLSTGLGTLCSGPTCANIFLTRVYRKSLCEIFLHPHEE